MAIKIKKSDLFIVYSIIAALLGSVLAGCQIDMSVGLDLSTSTTGVSVGGRVPTNPKSPTDTNIIDTLEIEDAITLSAPSGDPVTAVTKGNPVEILVNLSGHDWPVNNIAWYLNGDKLPDSNMEISISTDDLEKGWYQIVFTGDIGGSPYSTKPHRFEVQ
jgi:hypothetical protein